MLGSNTATAKKFIWDFVEIAKSLLRFIGPNLGLNTKEEISRFLDELEHCLSHTDCYVYASYVSAQKL